MNFKIFKFFVAFMKSFYSIKFKVIEIRIWYENEKIGSNPNI